MRINNKQKGLTIVELLIYFSILILIISVATTIVLSFSGIFEEIVAKREIDSNLSNTLERMIRDTRGATEVDFANSVFTTYPGVLQLLVPDEFGNQEIIKYYLDNGIIKIDREGALIGQLTSENVTITDFKFFYIDTGNSDAIRIVISGEINNGSEIISKTFYGLAVVRN